MSVQRTQPSPIDPDIAPHIRTIRGQRVLLDSDLAALYGVPTHRLNEAVKRNRARFPPDFAFQLTPQETNLISQTAISSSRHGGRRKPATVFTLDANTRKEFVRVYKAILRLMGPASPEQ